MSSDASVVFNRIRPYCVEFVQTKNLQSLRKFYKKLNEINQESLDEIALYILFPLRVALKNKEILKNEDFVCCVLECLTNIFTHAIVNDWNVINEILTQLCGIISNPKEKDMNARGSEEVKGGVASTIYHLFDHASLPIWRNMYDYSTIPLLGHVVTLLLSIAKENIERKARISALTALKSICKPSYFSLLEESEQNAAEIVIGDCIACFLPGVSISLSKIIASDLSAGHKIKSFCLEVLGVYLTATLSDKSTEISAVSKKSVSDINPRLKSLIVTRNDKWVSMVTKNLEPIINNACSASNSEEWSLRLNCVKFCKSILLHCSVNLKNHASTLLKVPVKLLNDDYVQIKQICSQILEDYSLNLQKTESKSQILVEILEENLFALCTSFPRYMRTMQDSEKLSTLKILLGYLTLLKDKINNLLYSQPHLKKLSSALLHSFELDTSSIQLMDIVMSSENGDNGFHSDNNSPITSCFRKEFSHFRNQDIFTTLKRICNILGQHGDCDVLLDHFLEIYNTSESFCKQAVLILSEILIGVEKGTRDTNFKIVQSSVKTLLEEYLLPENWFLVTRFDSEYLKTHHQTRIQKISPGTEMTVMPMLHLKGQKKLPLKQMKSNVILCCLHLEAILTFSRVLGNDFRAFLMYALYPLLEKTTEQDGTISSCAIRALRGVASYCGYSSSSMMIAENADYLISDISIQIHRIEVFPRCPAVLQAMLDNSNSDILALVSDTIDEILLSLDLHHLNLARLLVFLPVLLSVVKAVNRWTRKPDAKLFSEKDDFCSITNSESKESKINETVDTNENSETVTHNESEFNPADTCSSVNSTKNYETVEVKTEINSGDTFSHMNSAKIYSRKLFVKNLKKELLELHKNKKIANLETDAEVDPNWKPEQEYDAQHQHENENDEKPKIPMEITVVTKVLSRCIHLMAHSNPKVRMKVMEIVECGMSILSTHENELLPMTHKLWNPLVVRFGDGELQVVMKAFDTLCVIASYSKDFLRKRFCKEILPKLLSVLEIQAKKSVGLSKRPISGGVTSITIPWHLTMTPSQDTVAYMHSVAFKLQQKALKGLGPLLRNIEIDRTDLIKVCQTCLPYLSSKQPHQLQIDAISLFQTLFTIDRDVTWLQLVGLWCTESTLKPPEYLSAHPMGRNLQTIYLGGTTDQKSEFAVNVKKLLQLS
uniref:TELO2-interacting protein 1 homolog n=1 Tax=Styela clava TaxID=7725 RepID=UPI00193AA481|nr:TELO2-interacting protein 1 homolog [Styela clava]